MKRYDIAFSCGYACGVTQALREADLQFATLPFDWAAAPSFRRCAETLADGFAHWLDREDLELVDIRRGGINKRIYRNRRTGFGFVHDFTLFKTFEESYPKIAEKYARRISRFQESLESASAALAVYAECPKFGRLPDAELAEVRRIFSGRHPNVTFDLLYFYVREGCREAVAERVADGIVAVGLDYRTFEDGELNHQMDHSGITAYLKANVSVADPRTDAEKAAYAAEWTQQDKARWQGRNFAETFVNRTAFRLYRKLERFLTRKGLVPRERPL